MKVSIIIPAYCEEAVIGRTLEHTKNLDGCFELIVVDCQSPDRTAAIAREQGALVVQSKPGRAQQMNHGAAVATGDVLLFLHADTCLPEDFYSLIFDALRVAKIGGGCFRLGFDEPQLRLRLVAFLTRYSFRLFHYGDQAYFVRSGLFREMGGYRPYPIMEDLDFWLRFNRMAAVLIIPVSVRTSSRRFKKNGILTQQFVNTSLVALYLLGIDRKHLASIYAWMR